MAEIGLAVVQTLMAALQFSEVKEKCAIWNYKSQLEDLNKTVATIKNVLLDAESKVLTYETQGYINELKDALYEADDLFDEFVTLLELKQLQNSPTKLGELYHKVCRFFSYDENQVNHAYRMSRKVKKIRKKLNAIVDNHQKFSLGIDYEPICMRREETCSYIDTNGIIGRDNDKNTIIDKLLESKDQHVRFLTIVGMGGLGKTALAQLVYNDQNLKQEFGNSMFWVCVSDQDKVQFELKVILCKILESILHEKLSDSCSLDIVQKKFQNNLRGKKYFLILDDVWNEDRENWDGLETILKVGQGGSRILVTTRSEITSTTIRDGWTYRLQGLSPDHSWKLFEMTSFNKGSNQPSLNYMEMVEIGNKIVEKCNNIPLAIKVIGSLLFGQDISKWRSFQNSEIAKITNGNNKIMSVLKLSYHNLQPSLKSCFCYCAVFPKDFEMEKELLIKLWMAQGYIEPLNGGQSVEDAAEEYFKILLRRCFFQEVKRQEYDEIKSVKIHDLMHDVAQEMGGGEVQLLSSVDNTLGDRARHVTILDKKCFEIPLNWSGLRTLIPPAYCFGINCANVGNWKSLRVLKLKRIGRESALSLIGELQHLRYLDLSNGDFEELPNSITKLHNLQTLILFYCAHLRQLPHDYHKLVKLSHLNLDGCSKMTCTPLGLDKLKDVGALDNLAGRIDIEIGENNRNAEAMKEMSGGYLSKIPRLKEVAICDRRKYFATKVDVEAELEKLEPHPNLKKLDLNGYRGKTIPWWRRAKDNSVTIQLSNLVDIKFDVCTVLVCLPSLSKLPFLKSLKLIGLKNLEYMETRSNLPEASDTTFFPSLETLYIRGSGKWKGDWFRKEGLEDGHYVSTGILPFPCLSDVYICDCPKLMSFPPCPSVKSIHFNKVNRTSRLVKKMIGNEGGGEVTIDNHISSSSSSCIASLKVEYDYELENLLEFEKVFEMCASSLRSLTIEFCLNLRRISSALKHLTALENLYFQYNCQLVFSEDDNEEIMAWKPLHQSLLSLSFHYFNTLTSLPEGMQYLTSLQKLYLCRCEKFKGLPEWISSLSSLQTLVIYGCDAMESLPEGIQSLTSLQNLKIQFCGGLKERLRKPNGQDWPKIQHIPNLDIYIPAYL